MANSHSAFKGEIPHYYEKYLGPLIFQKYAEDLSRRIKAPDGGFILETAAGTGMATRQLRSAIQDDVRVVVTDLNKDMLTIAKQKFESTENIEFQTGNAQNLSFENSVFDAVICQFSLMFFEDKFTAIKEAARVLKPDGTFLFNVWDSFEHNHFIKTVNESIVKKFPDTPPDFFSIPYGYYNIDVIKDLLHETGFDDIEISVIPRTSTANSAKDVALGYILGTPVSLQIEKIAPGSLSDIVDSVEEAIATEFGSNNVSAKMQAIVFKAHIK